MSTTKIRTRQLTQFSILLALELILGFTPLGLIMIPPVAITLLHIPVIICGILMGPVWGGALGLSFGLISMYKATTAAVTPIDMAFSPFLSGKPLASLVMCLLPRILIGVFAALFFHLLSKRMKNNAVPVAISGVVTTILHTVMVLGALSLFFSELGVTAVAILATILSLNGGLEILAAAVIATPVCAALLRAFKRPT